MGRLPGRALGLCLLIAAGAVSVAAEEAPGPGDGGLRFEPTACDLGRLEARAPELLRAARTGSGWPAA
ncbi:MAG: hypothetical protein MI919_11655, partial [Holophagales bacterium]|nr:hypothetical protein [Holophagales bacterium]